MATTHYGARFVCDARDTIQSMIMHFGVWEPDVSRIIHDHLAAGDVVVDIGANIGYDTLLAASLVGPTGQVVAIEASPQTYESLKHNLRLNPEFAANVRTVNVAVAEVPGSLDLYGFGAANIGGTTTLPGRGGSLIATIDALPIDEILTTEEVSRTRLIKLDVEGAEPPILRHIAERLDDYPGNMEIIVEANTQDDFAAWNDVFERLRAAGFAAFAIANRYDVQWYLRWKPTSLTYIEGTPAKRTDVLFTRQPELV
jgi:FkbM family methyltransferase